MDTHSYFLRPGRFPHWTDGRPCARSFLQALRGNARVRVTLPLNGLTRTPAPSRQAGNAFPPGCKRLLSGPARPAHASTLLDGRLHSERRRPVSGRREGHQSMPPAPGADPTGPSSQRPPGLHRTDAGTGAANPRSLPRPRPFSTASMICGCLIRFTATSPRRQTGLLRQLQHLFRHLTGSCERIGEHPLKAHGAGREARQIFAPHAAQRVQRVRLQAGKAHHAQHPPAARGGRARDPGREFPSPAAENTNCARLSGTGCHAGCILPPG